MSKAGKVVVSLMFLLGMAGLAMAAEHGGSAMHEHGGATTATPAMTSTPSNDDIRNAMKGYVEEQAKASGTFDIQDPETGNLRKLSLERVHERVGKTGENYYSCADFKDTGSGELLDLDLDVKNDNGTLMVVDVRIHKLNGNPRYTYDENDNRIPLPDAKAEMQEMKKEGEGMMEDMGGMEQHDHAKEHGGKEHAGN